MLGAIVQFDIVKGFWRLFGSRRRWRWSGLGFRFRICAFAFLDFLRFLPIRCWHEAVPIIRRFFGLSFFLRFLFLFLCLVVVTILILFFFISSIPSPLTRVTPSAFSFIAIISIIIILLSTVTAIVINHFGSDRGRGRIPGLLPFL